MLATGRSCIDDWIGQNPILPGSPVESGTFFEIRETVNEIHPAYLKTNPDDVQARAIEVT